MKSAGRFAYTVSGNRPVFPKHMICRNRAHLCTWLLLLFAAGQVAAGPDTVLKDFDIDVTQAECRARSINILQQLATDDVPVMELGHVISYSGGDAELIAVCRADRGLLVVFARGGLTRKALVGFHAAFGGS